MNSELWDEQRLAGGVLPEEEAIVPWTYRFCAPPVLHFGDPHQEYLAAESGAILFDLGDRSQIEMTGKDRQQFLHNFCTNDIKRLERGEGCEAFVTNVNGRILAHIFVFVGENSLWIETGPGAEDALLAHLDKYIINEDVQLQSRTAEHGELLLSGPGCRKHLAIFNVESDKLQVHNHLTVDRPNGRLAIRRVDLVGSPGFLLSTERTLLAGLWNELISSGVSPGGAAVFHALRIASGFPLYGLDLSSDNLAQEAARTDLAISLTKGCYLGQEPIARIDALGHVNRLLRGLCLKSALPPAPGDAILSSDGKQIGAITSSAAAGKENRSIALGFVRTSHAKPGTTVRVLLGDSEFPATVFWDEKAE